MITDENHIGLINPYRYRSYRYDSETGLYYLQSRYYNPEWGRFINADGLLESGHEVLGNNLYAYCSNNPINKIDEEGTVSSLALGFLVIALVTAITITTIPVTTNNYENSEQIIGTAINTFIEATKKVALSVKDKVQAKIKAKKEVKNRSDTIRYWLADENANRIEPLDFEHAKMEVALGNNIMCVNQRAAFGVAVFYNGKLCDERHRNRADYFPHFHVKSTHGRPHIWFYDDKSPKPFERPK